jgi:hypothetical protein
LLLVPILAALPAAAQIVDEQTKDYEDQDRRYQERYREEEEKDGAPAERIDPEAFLAKAEELVQDKNYWSRSSDHYRVQTNDPRLDSKATLELLDSFRSFFDSFWTGRVELRRYDEKSRVFLLDSFYLYNQLLNADYRGRLSRPKGHYVSFFNVIVLHTTADNPADLPDSLVHEAAHQLVDRRLFSSDRPPSLWVSEGLASYFGYTFRDGSGEFRPGLVGGKSTVLLEGAPERGKEGPDRLRRFRRTVKSFPLGDSSLVEWLVEVQDPALFYGENVDFRYSTSWLLVHFLLHGEDGRHAGAFARYVTREVRGGGGRDALFEELGVTPEALDAALLSHLKQIKTR